MIEIEIIDCAECGQPIETRWDLLIADWIFHPNCWDAAGPDRPYTEDEIANFARFRQHRAEYRPECCTGGATCWIEQGPPAISPGGMPGSARQGKAGITHEYVRRRVGAQEAVQAARFYCSSVDARVGTTRRVIITDSGDDTVFEWQFGEGVTFPPEAAGKVPLP